MAQPGETFPAEFALGILNLAQQRKIKQADMEEMRAARAERNFLDKERIALAERGQSLQEFQAGTSAKAMEFQHEIQKEAALARIKIESDKIVRERESQVIQNLNNFGRTGSAFIPSYAADKVGQLTSSAGSEYGVATIQIPGLGTLVQKVSDPTMKADLDKTHAEIFRLQQQKALDAVKTQLTSEKVETEKQQRGTLVGRVGADVIRSANTLYADLTKRAGDRALTLQFGSAADKELGKRIAIDPGEAFKGTPDETLWEKSRLLLGAAVDMQAQGIDVNKVKTDLSALDSVGATQVALWQPPTQAPTVVGKFAGRAKGGETAYKLLLSNNQQVEVDRDTYNTTETGKPFTSTGSPAAAPAGNTPLGPTTSPGSGPQAKVSPDRAKAIRTEIDSLKESYLKTRDKATYERLIALAKELEPQ